ncbi:MAG: dihydroorotate dehydrogenase electron transfer subunit [Phycisphaerae bacterium]|nr:dihydroorotate dehydrogenase electron transfer subunit [Phycisphaerae bacterium]
MPCRAHFELTLFVEGFPSATPGQFVQVRRDSLLQRAERRVLSECDEAGVSAARGSTAGCGPLLRRPFSIAGLRRAGGRCEIDLLGRVVGAVTRWMAALSPGDPISVLGPLGAGFSAPARGQRALLVAGGIGLPPIRWLGERLRQDGVTCDAIYGAQTRDSLPITLTEEPSTSGALTSCVEEFSRNGIPVAITTDDGTCGARGRVTDMLIEYLDDCDDVSSVRVYGCGPEPMLRAVASLCVRRGVDCELALERTMGCGMGVCQSCVVPVVDESGAEGWRYALCCTEGPVFDASHVKWS